MRQRSTISCTGGNPLLLWFDACISRQHNGNRRIYRNLPNLSLSLSTGQVFGTHWSSRTRSRLHLSEQEGKCQSKATLPLLHKSLGYVPSLQSTHSRWISTSLPQLRTYLEQTRQPAAVEAYASHDAVVVSVVVAVIIYGGGLRLGYSHSKGSENTYLIFEPYRLYPDWRYWPAAFACRHYYWRSSPHVWQAALAGSDGGGGGFAWRGKAGGCGRRVLPANGVMAVFKVRLHVFACAALELGGMVESVDGDYWWVEEVEVGFSSWGSSQAKPAGPVSLSLTATYNLKGGRRRAVQCAEFNSWREREPRGPHLCREGRQHSAALLLLLSSRIYR